LKKGSQGAFLLVPPSSRGDVSLLTGGQLKQKFEYHRTLLGSIVQVNLFSVAYGFAGKLVQIFLGDEFRLIVQRLG